MEESSSEMSSEEQLFEMLKWNTAGLIAVLDHHGGTIRVEKGVLESIDMSKRAVRFSYDAENEFYIIEGVNDAV